MEPISEKLIAETVANVVADNAEFVGVLAGLSALLAEQLPRLLPEQKAFLQTNAKSLKAQAEQRRKDAETLREALKRHYGG